MGPIEITVIVVLVLIVILILSYFIYKKYKGESIECDCKKRNGKKLVKEYYKKYKEK